MKYKVEHTSGKNRRSCLFLIYSSLFLNKLFPLLFLKKKNSFHYLLKNKILSVFLLKVCLKAHFDILLQTQSNHLFLFFFFALTITLAGSKLIFIRCRRSGRAIGHKALVNNFSYQSVYKTWFLKKKKKNI